MITESRTLPTDLAAIDTIIAGKRPEADVYPTPSWAVEQILQAGRYSLTVSVPDVLDPGAGDGVWGRHASELMNADVTGVELRALPSPLFFNEWHGDTDYLTWWPMNDMLGDETRFDLIIGNPPYSLAEEFIRHSFELLAPGGQVIFLLRLAFLGGQDRAKRLWTEHPPERVLVMPKRPSFSGNGKTDRIEYAAFYWRDGFKGAPALGWLS